MYYQQHYGPQTFPRVAYSVDLQRLDGVRRPARRRGSRLTQAVFVVLFLSFIFAVTYTLVHFVGLESLAQLHGLDRVIDTMGIEAPPKL